MRRLVIILLALLAATPISAILDAGTALAADTGPALVPGARTGSVPVRAGSLDASDRWIVVLRSGASLPNANATARGLGIREDHQFNGTFRGYAARLTNGQLARLRADPIVETVVPDDIVTLTGQTTPTGVERVYGAYNPIAKIDGEDTRVDADVAIVDTGIDPNHVDLNVAGGYNCSTTTTSAWYDSNGHGTHVAGIVGALDNGYGVVGVAPGVRLWAVRILNSAGNGLLSWYVCGLDWIMSQKDPTDPTRPMFEAVNMSVAKPGSDDGNCGYTNDDILHRAICRVFEAGITVVAAAGNNSQYASHWVPAAYNQVITVSALADTDGKPGGLGGHACYSWNSYDKDDTFADFSNYGSDIDLIAPGKCILSTLPGNRYGVLSGTSMAAPLVTGAVALYKSTRPLVTPTEVKHALQAMGNLDWKTSTDPDSMHEPLLDVSWIVNAGDFALRSLQRDTSLGGGGTAKVAMNLVRAEDFTAPVDVSVDAASPVTASLSATHFEAGDDGSLTLTINVPKGTPSDAYLVTVTASDGSRQRTATVRVLVDGTPPVVTPPVISVARGSTFQTRWFQGAAHWHAATDDSSGVVAYQAQWSLNGGSFGPAINLGGSTVRILRHLFVTDRYVLRIRAQDGAGNWSAWVSSPTSSFSAVQDTSGSLAWGGSWRRVLSSSASGGSTKYSTRRGASVTLKFTGSGIAIIAPVGSTRGRFDVWLDGTRVAKVSEHATSTHVRRVLWLRSGLPNQTHTLKLVNVATPGHTRVDLDALLVLK